MFPGEPSGTLTLTTSDGPSHRGTAGAVVELLWLDETEGLGAGAGTVRRCDGDGVGVGVGVGVTVGAGEEGVPPRPAGGARSSWAERTSGTATATAATAAAATAQRGTRAWNAGPPCPRGCRCPESARSRICR